MKRLFILTVLLSSMAPCSYSQLVPSSCTAPQSVVDMYNDDADRMAVRNTFRNNTTWIDSVRINNVLKDTLLEAMLAVYNATSLPARDTVTTILNIHPKPVFFLDELIVGADSTLSWVKEFQQGKLITGSIEVDSLIALGNIDSVKMEYYSVTSQAQYMTLSAPFNQNLIPVVNGFNSLSGVVDAYQNYRTGIDGPEIQDSIYAGFVELIYSYGWDDCYLGCRKRRFWAFRIYPGCMVEYMGSYGDVLPAGILSLDDPESKELLISPNPFNDHINVSGAAQSSRYMLYNSIGQKLQSGDLTDERIEVSSQLPPGAYYLVLQTGKGRVENHRLIKR